MGIESGDRPSLGRKVQAIDKEVAARRAEAINKRIEGDEEGATLSEQLADADEAISAHHRDLVARQEGITEESVVDVTGEPTVDNPIDLRGQDEGGTPPIAPPGE